MSAMSRVSRPADLDADGVGEHELADARGRFHRDRRSDPAAERDARQRYIAQVELVEQVEIVVGEVVDRIDALRQLGGAKARMRRRDQARLRREPVEHRRRRIEPDAGVQEQQRPALAALEHVHGDAVDLDRDFVSVVTREPPDLLTISISSCCYIMRNPPRQRVFFGRTGVPERGFSCRTKRARASS